MQKFSNVGSLSLKAEDFLLEFEVWYLSFIWSFGAWDWVLLPGNYQLFNHYYLHFNQLQLLRLVAYLNK